MECDGKKMRYGVVRVPTRIYVSITSAEVKCGSYVGIGLEAAPYVSNSKREPMVAYMLGK